MCCSTPRSTLQDSGEGKSSQQAELWKPGCLFCLEGNMARGLDPCSFMDMARLEVWLGTWKEPNWKFGDEEVWKRGVSINLSTWTPWWGYLCPKWGLLRERSQHSMCSVSPWGRWVYWIWACLPCPQCFHPHHHPWPHRISYLLSRYFTQHYFWPGNSFHS